MVNSGQCNSYFRGARYERMKKLLINPIDMSRVETLIYHLPDGPSFSVDIHGLEALIDIDLEQGDVCDTSDIDGVVHFFPRGNA